ncbi:MAG: substrate-binding domain-containing protein [Phycisphaerales bacterium]
MRGPHTKSTLASAVATLLLFLGATACERSSGGADPVDTRRPAEILVVTTLEPLMREALDAYAPTGRTLDYFLRPGSSQSLARQVDAGVRADLVVTGDPGSLQGISPAPRSVHPWIINRLVVVAASEGRTLREFDFGQSRIAVADDTTELGLHTRLAMRQREVWNDAQGRLDRLSADTDVVDRVLSGASAFGVVHATAARSPGLVIVGELDLPDSVELEYFLAPLTDEGDRIAAWLAGPDGLGLATGRGFESADPR